ncbi:hypothetical protein V6N13_038928 [Hibiscus sabdariffa]
MEEEGTRSTSERLSSSSMATKIVASEPNREQTMENVQLIHASRRTESIVSGKEVVSMGESSMATIGDNCALKTVAAPEKRWLPTEILDSIATVPPPATHYGADTPGWRWSDKREFSVGSTYSVLMGAEAQNRNPICKEVWCTLCFSGSEDMNHVLRFCTCARELWNVVIKQELAALGRTQSMSGLIYATLPSLVAALTEEDRRRWEAYGSITEDISQCSRRVDPGG